MLGAALGALFALIMAVIFAFELTHDLNALLPLLAASTVAYADETCRAIATRMAVHGVKRMPVVESKASARLVGIISRSDLVKPAAVLFDEEHLREKFRTLPFAELQRRFKVSRLP